MKNLFRTPLLLAFALLTCFAPRLTAGPGDTTKVQVFTFGNTQDTVIDFPSDTISYERVWLYYRLKCVPGNNPSCGEWDYLTYTNLYDSTGVMDSTLLSHPNFLVGNQSPDSFAFSINPTWTYQDIYQYFIVYDNTTSENTYTIGTGASPLAHQADFNQADLKVQYLWTAAELISAGVTPGDIHSLSINIASLGSAMNYLTLKMKNSALSSLSPTSMETSGFTTVYQYNTTPGMIGWNRLNFTTPFNWDGVSNIVVEFSFDNPVAGTAHVAYGDATAFSSGVYSTGNDQYLDFEGDDYVSMQDFALPAIDSFITISFWQYGDPGIQPQNDWSFEGRDANDNRVICGHVPWGDATVYFDCGNSGTASWDRINKAATATEFEGQWNFWTFTKNVATGSMKIYLNGNLWHSGTALTRYLTPIKTFKIGAEWNGYNNYDGYMDEFQIWNTELDQATIAAWMYQDITPSHPYYSNLVFYHQWNEGSGGTVADASTSGADGSLFGTPQFNDVGGVNLFRNFTAVSERPQIRFIQGVYTSHIDSTLVTDSVLNNPISVVLYSDSLNPTTATDTLYVWPAEVYTYTYDQNGNVTDSVWVNADTTLIKVEWPYWSEPFEIVDRYEIMRFITPYGIGLDLGPNGWLWKFDMTDYLPILKGRKRLTAGNWQELLDMSFIFVEGTPSRDPLTVENLWQGDFALSTFATTVPAQTVMMNPAASMFRMKTRATGHQFSNPTNCAEFCSKIHSVKVNSFTVRSWQIMEECAENALYPQGGTWIYDRAGWCPGKEGTTYDTEITQFVTPGQNAVLDYDAVSDPYGNYVFEGQLISYGPANFSLDAAVEDIVAPSNYEMHTRYNPTCGKPTIKIRNSGSTTLTALKINYGVIGGPTATYNWTGTLDFLEVETVELPLFSWGTGGNEFEVNVNNPNGGSDEYSPNNTMRSTFDTVPVYPGTFVIYFRTNNAGSETTWKLSDDSGNILYQNTIFLGPNTTFIDTIVLPNGCYNLRVNDSGQDGLDFFANNDGTGFFRLRDLAGNYFRTFEQDFGKFIQQNFSVTNGVSIDPSADAKPSLEIFPNPNNGSFAIEVAGMANQEVKIEVTDLSGRVVYRESQKLTQNVEHLQISLQEAPDGIYLVNVTGESSQVTEKISVSK